MSEDQLTKIFPNSKRVKEPQRHLPHAIEALIIDDYIEDGLHYSVTFYIDSSTRGLVRVIQTYYGPSAVDAYDQLRDGLKEKYGPTSEPETDASYLKVMEWNSPTTRIELLYGSEGLVGREYTFLSYKLADQMNEAK